MTIFDKRGNYVRPSDPIGGWSDTLLTGNMPNAKTSVLDESVATHIGAPGEWNVAVQKDYERIVTGSPESPTNPWVLARLADMDVDPRAVHQLSRSRRAGIGNALVREARREEVSKKLRLGQSLTFAAGTNMDEIMNAIEVKGEKLGNVLLTARDKDICELDHDGTRITVAAIKHLIMQSFGLTPEQYAMLTDDQQIRIRHKILRAARRLVAEQKEKSERAAKLRAERTILHVSLRQWARGPLALERPSGSSLHHLLDYDSGSREDDVEFENFVNSDEMQIILVENDWASVVPPQAMKEEFPPLPFEKCCWEFRISGVRVLAFTHAEPLDDPLMFCVYGRDRQWVIDDYSYRLGNGKLRRDERTTLGVDAVEFSAVARLVMAGIRASCIMMDAGICEREHVPVPRKLSERRAKENRSLLRDHYVVSLLRRQRTRVARSAGAGIGSGTPQRGHWRPGRYMHFDRQDAGQIQYVNDGGFFVSKTWMRWHFAGDPDNIIHKEYRL